jgi:TctA family transporter
MAPLLLALVLGDRLESSFRLSLTMSGGSYATFLDTASLVVLGSVLGLLLLIQDLRGCSAIASRSLMKLSALREIFHLNQVFE